MIMKPSGFNFQLAVLIYNKVGDRRFRCADVEPDYPMLRSFLQKLCACGILIKYRLVHGKANEYQLTTIAIEKIKQHGEVV
jgi:hypothetical protein